MSWLREVIEHLKEQRQIIINGGVNCIPSPLTRFRRDFPGIQKFYYVVTGGTKSAKTQLTNYLFVITPILYWLEHPNQVSKPKIFYFPLEEDRMSITLRFYSHIIKMLSGIRVSPTDLESIDERKPLQQEVLDLMETEEFQRYAKAFEECVEFREERNPTGIFLVIKDYMEKHGTVTYKTQKIIVSDEFNVKHEEEIKAFDKYVPDDPNQYVIGITDHASLLHIEKSQNSIMETINAHSDNCIILRNRYGVTSVLVQQQNKETTSLDAFKASKIRPTKDGLKNSTKPGEDCTVLIGITNPKSFDLQEYLGYNIVRLKEWFRVIEIVLNRKGIANGLCPLLFDGATCSFAEMPLPTETSRLEEIYRYINSCREQLNVALTSFNKNFNNKFGGTNIFKYLCTRFSHFFNLNK